MNKCPYDPTVLKGVPIGMLHCPECGEMILAGVPHPDYSLLGDPDPVTEEEWKTRKNPEHPCDHWDIDQCVCKGACGCHYKFKE